MLNAHWRQKTKKKKEKTVFSSGHQNCLEASNWTLLSFSQYKISINNVDRSIDRSDFLKTASAICLPLLSLQQPWTESSRVWWPEGSLLSLGKLLDADKTHRGRLNFFRNSLSKSFPSSRLLSKQGEVMHMKRRAMIW